jgi:hypothetical protein
MGEKKFRTPEEVAAWKAKYQADLDTLVKTTKAAARLKDDLALGLNLIDKVGAGYIMDAIIHGKGYLNSISDVGSDSIAFVYNNGWALGFEGDGGELVIALDYIEYIRPRKTGVEISLDSGEQIYLRFHGRWQED